MNETNKSEVAQLLENIRLSYESAYFATHGPAIVASHEFISKKLENMQYSHAQLQTIVREHVRPSQPNQPIPVVNIRKETLQERFTRLKRTADATGRRFLHVYLEDDKQRKVVQC